MLLHSPLLSQPWSPRSQLWPCPSIPAPFCQQRDLPTQSCTEPRSTVSAHALCLRHEAAGMNRKGQCEWRGAGTRWRKPVPGVGESSPRGGSGSGRELCAYRANAVRARPGWGPVNLGLHPLKGRRQCGEQAEAGLAPQAACLILQQHGCFTSRPCTSPEALQHLAGSRRAAQRGELWQELTAREAGHLVRGGSREGVQGGCSWAMALVSILLSHRHASECATTHTRAHVDVQTPASVHMHGLPFPRMHKPMSGRKPGKLPLLPLPAHPGGPLLQQVEEQLPNTQHTVKAADDLSLQIRLWVKQGQSVTSPEQSLSASLSHSIRGSCDQLHGGDSGWCFPSHWGRGRRCSRGRGSLGSGVGAGSQPRLHHSRASLMIPADLAPGCRGVLTAHTCSAPDNSISFLWDCSRPTRGGIIWPKNLSAMKCSSHEPGSLGVGDVGTG